MNDKPKRRRFRFSLRTLLVLVATACVGFGWLGYKMREAGRQRQAMEAIVKIGGYVTYDYQHISGQYEESARFPAAAWMRCLFGDDLFVNVDGVSLDGTPVTDSDLVHLEVLSQLRYLHLSKTNITDSGLDHLRPLTQLATVWLGRTKITDAGLECIQGMEHLKSLDLSGTVITGEGLKSLRGMSQLESLDLMGTPVNDAGLVCLHELSNLRRLCLYDSKVTPEGRKQLQRVMPTIQIDQLK